MMNLKNPAYFLKIQGKRLTHPRQHIRDDALAKLKMFAYGTEEHNPYDFYPVRLVNITRKLLVDYL